MDRMSLCSPVLESRQSGLQKVTKATKSLPHRFWNQACGSLRFLGFLLSFWVPGCGVRADLGIQPEPEVELEQMERTETQFSISVISVSPG